MFETIFIVVICNMLRIISLISLQFDRCFCFVWMSMDVCDCSCVCVLCMNVVWNEPTTSHCSLSLSISRSLDCRSILTSKPLIIACNKGITLSNAISIELPNVLMQHPVGWTKWAYVNINETIKCWFPFPRYQH